MKTNRRGFMQRCFGVLGGMVAAFGGSKITTGNTRKSFAVPVHYRDKTSTGINRFFTPFHGYLLRANDNRLSWEWGNGDSGTLVILPTEDRFKHFHLFEGRLFWVGERETWEIQYIGGVSVFQWTLVRKQNSQTSVCYCDKPLMKMCNYPGCKDYNPGNKKPYKDEYKD